MYVAVPSDKGPLAVVHIQLFQLSPTVRDIALSSDQFRTKSRDGETLTGECHDHDGEEGSSKHVDLRRNIKFGINQMLLVVGAKV